MVKKTEVVKGDVKGVKKPFRFEVYNNIPFKNKELEDKDAEVYRVLVAKATKPVYRVAYVNICNLYQQLKEGIEDFYYSWYGYSITFSYIHNVSSLKANPDYTLKNTPTYLEGGIDILYELLVTYSHDIGVKRISKKKYRAVVVWFVTHLHRCYEHNHLAIKYSRDESFNKKYDVRTPDISHPVILRLVEMLVARGSAISLVGNPLYGNSSMSMLVMNPDIYAELGFNGSLERVQLDRGPCVVVRDVKGNDININELSGDTMDTVNYGIEVLNKYHELFNNNTITINGVKVPEPWFKRVHREDVGICGRVFDDGTIQGKPKYIRKLIKIDGEDTVSLDFKGLHMAILMFEAGVATNGHDPYPIITGVDIDHTLKDKFTSFYGIKGYNPLRNLVKKLTLCLINASSVSSAVGATYHILRKDNVLKGTYQEHQMQFVGLPYLNLHEVAEQIMSHNEFIRDKLGCGEGNRLQALDSNIIMRCLDILTVRDIPVLPIHDALICKVSDKKTVECIMVESFVKFVGVGSEVNCKVEEE